MNEEDRRGLETTIAALLCSGEACDRVKDQLKHSEAAWQDRAVISDLRARRAENLRAKSLELEDVTQAAWGMTSRSAWN